MVHTNLKTSQVFRTRGGQIWDLEPFKSSRPDPKKSRISITEDTQARNISSFDAVDRKEALDRLWVFVISSHSWPQLFHCCTMLVISNWCLIIFLGKFWFILTIPSQSSEHLCLTYFKESLDLTLWNLEKLGLLESIFAQWWLWCPKWVRCPKWVIFGNLMGN